MQQTVIGRGVCATGSNREGGVQQAVIGRGVCVTGSNREGCVCNRQ